MQRLGILSIIMLHGITHHLVHQTFYRQSAQAGASLETASIGGTISLPEVH